MFVKDSLLGHQSTELYAAAQVMKQRRIKFVFITNLIITCKAILLIGSSEQIMQREPWYDKTMHFFSEEKFKLNHTYLFFQQKTFDKSVGVRMVNGGTT